MKKFISLFLAAAMAITMIPATAFADVSAVKLVGKEKVPVSDSAITLEKAQLQMKVTDEYNLQTGGKEEITLKLDNAKWADDFQTALGNNSGVLQDTNLIGVSGKTNEGAANVTDDKVKVTLKSINSDKDELVFSVEGLKNGDLIFVNMKAKMTNGKTVGRTAKVSVDNDSFSQDSIVFAETVKGGLDVTVNRVTELTALDVDKATKKNLEKITMKEVAGDELQNGRIVLLYFKNDDFGVKVADSGKATAYKGDAKATAPTVENATYSGYSAVKITLNAEGDKLVLDKGALEIWADEVSVGSSCKMNVRVFKDDSDYRDDKAVYSLSSMEVAKVVKNDKLEVVYEDKDKDMPVVFAGLADKDSGWKAQPVKIKGMMKGENLEPNKKLTLSLPQGVYVTALDISGDVSKTYTSTDSTDLKYDVNSNEIEFARNVFDDIKTAKDDELVFQIYFVTEPDFKGDVKATFSGSALKDSYSIKIAEVKPVFSVDASSVKVESGFKTVELPGSVIVKETEKGVLERSKTIYLVPEKSGTNRKGNETGFEFDATVNKESGMQIDVKRTDGKITIKSTSDDKAGEITLTKLEATIPTYTALGKYDLRILYSGYDFATLPTVDNGKDNLIGAEKGKNSATADGPYLNKLQEYGTPYFTAHKDYLDVVSAGTSTTKPSFTNRVEITIGANQIVVNGKPSPMETPAYVNADNRTMVPLRAVAVALGVNDDQIVWVAATKTVVINYGDTWISMEIGKQIMKVNGIEMAMTTAPEIKSERTFLPMADLGRALGVTAQWDAAKKTASFNK